MSAKLPGRPRPQAEALADYQRQRAEWISTRAQPVAAALLYPLPEQAHRWRIQLDCGHICEVWTAGKDDPPSEAQWHVDGFSILRGEYLCPRKECCRSRSRPVRDITSWDSRDGEHPPDPEEPPDWWPASGVPEGAGSWAELWALQRRSEPRARWAVTLSCGHRDHALAKLGWQPADGITRNPPADDDERARQQAELAELEDKPETHHQFTRRYFAEDFPEPAPFTSCFTCPWARKITAEQYVGPLVAPPRPPRKAPDARAVLKRHLREAERQAADLRKQLAALDSDEPEP